MQYIIYEYPNKSKPTRTTLLEVFFRDAAKKVYTNPRGEDTKVAASTIECWFYTYQTGGFDALLPKRRIDTGKPRKLDTDITEQISFLKKEYPRISATLIHQKLIDNGTIKPGNISLSTITRYVNMIKSEEKITINKDMRRYEREHINEVWCGDSSVGPYLNVDGKKKRTYVIALIDLLAARIGSVIHYSRPYTPTGKAKIERWFRTMKDKWMSQLNIKDFNSLSELTYSLYAFVNTYNKSVHSSLDGKTPQDRFFEEESLIKRLTSEQIETSFLLEYEHRVSSDNVVILNERLYCSIRYGF